MKKLRQNITFIAIILMFAGFFIAATNKEDFSAGFFWGIGLIIAAGIIALFEKQEKGEKW